MDCSGTEINVLGVTITTLGNKLETNFFFKPNDTQQHLHAKLCHRNVYLLHMDRL